MNKASGGDGIPAELFQILKMMLKIKIVFPVVMYGCESWTIQKAECKELMLLNCGVREDS